MPRHPDRSAPGPLVAVTATIHNDDDGVARVRLGAAYLRVIERAGLTPVVVPPFAGTPDAVAAAVGRVLDAVDGLVLTGGEDVEPARYGAAPSPHIQKGTPARDATELALVEEARRRALPTLAICRGVQVLNVALGGSLIQDIPTERPGSLDHDPDLARDVRTHPIRILPGSRTSAALGTDALQVNSVHHQAVDRIASGLVVTATSPDGIVEGVETPADDPWWVLGVQWHPEEFVADVHAPDHTLFAALAAALALGAAVPR